MPSARALAAYTVPPFLALAVCLAGLVPAPADAAPIRVPIRWCVLAEMDPPFSAADPGGGPSFEDPGVVVDADGDPETSVKGVLWRRGERMTDNIYLSQANVTFRSGATFQQPAFPVIDDEVRVAGDAPGDLLASCAADGSDPGLCSGVAGDGGAEFDDAVDRCRDAWLNADPASEGIIAIQANQIIDDGGDRVTIGGFAYSGGALGPRAGVVDVAYFQPDTAFTWPEFDDVLGVPGDWQEKLLGHEIGHSLTLEHIAPLNGPTSDNVMQYELPSDPDPAVSMFGTIITATQAADVTTFACGSIGGVQNCPDNPPALRTGSATDARGDTVFPLVDVTALAVTEDPFEEELRLMVDLAELAPGQTVIVGFFVDTDDDESTGGDPTDLVPAYEGPGGVELAARVNLASLDVELFEFDGADFAAVDDAGIDAALTPLVASADDVFGGTTTELDMGVTLAVRIPAGLVQPPGDVVTAGVRAHVNLPDGGDDTDHAAAELVLARPTYPSCEVSPDSVEPGEEVEVAVQEMPSDLPVIVYLGDRRVAEGATDLTGSASLDVTIPADARPGLRLVTVGVDDDVNAVTADCEVEVLGEDGGGGGGGGGGEPVPIPFFCKLLLVLCLLLVVLCLLLVVWIWKLRKVVKHHGQGKGYA